IARGCDGDRSADVWIEGRDRSVVEGRQGAGGEVRQGAGGKAPTGCVRCGWLEPVACVHLDDVVLQIDAGGAGDERRGLAAGALVHGGEVGLIETVQADVVSR